MDSARFVKLRAIALSVAATPPERRHEALVQQCGDDDAMRAMVLRLLQFDPGDSTLDDPDLRSGGVGRLTAPTVAVLDEPSPRPRGALDDPDAPPQGPLPAGNAIAGYRIIRKLGEGGMGEVYLAEDMKLGRRVALKFLRPALVAPGTLTRFIHEARAAAAIDHPNICTVYGIHEAGGRTFIAMACIDGMTLRQRISSGPLAIDETLAIGLQIARGLIVTHEKGIIHRDLKPSNVMLSTDGSVKIVDFGIAQSRDRLSIGRSGARMGTLAYMSPEQLRGDQVDHRADVWALGVVLFEMLAGRTPFGGESDDALCRHIVHDRPPRLSATRDHVPSVLSALVERCLAKEPASRPDAAEIAQVLEALESTSVAVPRIRGHRTWTLAAAGIALLAIPTALGWWRGWFGAGSETMPPGAHLTRLTVLPDKVSNALLPGSISPDGRSLALPLRHLRGDWAALGVFSIETGRTRYAEGPAGEVYSVRWMPDGETLLTFEYEGDLPWRERAASEDSRAQIWLRNIVRKTNQKVYEHPYYTTVLWPVVSSDGSKIAMLGGDRQSVWIMSTTGEERRTILELPADEEIRSLVWSPSSSRVAYVRTRDRAHGGLASIETCDLEGNRTVVFEGTADLDPGREDVTLCWLPDGRLIFNRFTNLFRTTSALWSMPVDPVTGLRDGNPARLLELDGAAFGQPTASADGRRLAFYKWQANLRPYLLELDATTDSVGVRRWTSQDWHAFPGTWTRNGRELFFTVATSKGDCDIYAGDMETGFAEPVITTSEQEYVAGLTPDGSELLFWQADRLKRMPVDGGTAVEIFRSPTPVTSWRDAVDRVMCPSESGSRCVLRRVEGDETVFYEFDHRDGSVHEEIARVGFALLPPSGRCDLSPDGTRIAIVANATLRVLDLHDGLVREIETEWTGVPRSASWSGDGTWLCVTGVAGEASNWVRRVDLDGSSKFLYRSEHTGLVAITRPSPEGAAVALVVSHGENDVWMMEDF